MIWSFLAGLAGKVFGGLLSGLFGHPAPTAEGVALKSNEEANAQLDKAVRARVADDTRRVLSDGAANTVTLDPDASVNTSPDAHFRD